MKNNHTAVNFAVKVTTGAVVLLLLADFIYFFSFVFMAMGTSFETGLIFTSLLVILFFSGWFAYKKIKKAKLEKMEQEMTDDG